MNYAQTIEYLYTQLPMFTRLGPKAYKADLHNTLALCHALGNPHLQFKSIHIAGTNGKGSSSHMLAAILQQAGYKTALYTSPHIKDFGERIRINGQMIDPQFVVDFVANTRQLTAQVQPSFFELTVAMAFAYFAEQKVDIAIIETGLGGLLDSTNVIQPLLSIISNIGLDHVNILGNTLAEIAYQKAGIIKKNTPAIIGEYLPETRPVFEKAASQQNAPLYFAADLYEATPLKNDALLECMVHNKSNGLYSKYLLDLTGSYQLKNLPSVLLAASLLPKLGFTISEQAISLALQKVKLLTGMRGRWDILQQAPTIIQDVAHNADGIAQVLLQLKNNYPLARLHFVIGFVKDKDIQQVLALLPADASYYFTQAHLPRALPAADLKEMAAAHQLKGHSFENINQAIGAAKAKALPTDVIMICGSFFIIAEIEEGM